MHRTYHMRGADASQVICGIGPFLLTNLTVTGAAGGLDQAADVELAISRSEASANYHGKPGRHIGRRAWNVTP